VVKKSSFLEKIRSRLRTGDLRVERPTDFTSAARGAGAENAAPEAARLDAVPATREPELVSGRKLSRQEEATVAVQDGFRELTSLLRGMQSRVEEQGERFVRATDNLARMPELQVHQLDALRRIAQHIEVQGQSQALIAQSLGDLPQLLGTVREALDRAAAVDERTAGTLDEFRSHMARIQGSMERMVDHSRQHAESARNLAEGHGAEVAELREVTSSAVESVKRSQSESISALRNAHADQATRISQLVEEGQRRQTAVIVLLGLVLVVLLGIGMALLLR
jgi:methyl-accepting chemotaxis protein